MHKTHFLYIAICCLLGVLSTGCSQQEDDIQINDSSSKLHQLYDVTENIETESIFSSLNPASRSSSSSNTYPVFTQKDLTYLASLSQAEFQLVIDDFNSQLTTNERIEAEEIQDSLYIEVFNILDGHEGMDNLISFAQRYMEASQGWNSIESLLPSNLSHQQGEIYIRMAVYVDKIARPIYNQLVDLDNPTSRAILSNGDDPTCKWYLTQRLAIAGIAMSAEAFLDAMTGGAATPIEVVATGADLVGIWLDYEVCNHRWH